LISQQAPSFSSLQLDIIADQIAQTGYIIINNMIDQSLLKSLHSHALSLNEESWREAGIGRNAQYLQNKQIRSDKIHWIDATNQAQTDFLNLMNSLREGINQRLFMGLFDFESHFAVYQPGQFYQRHVDALKGRSNRMLSTVLYLNDQWQNNNGGELLIYKDGQNAPIAQVTPQMGSMAIFLSEEFPHEVLSAKKTRYSIAGWFRVNNNLNGVIDPDR
jgi:SM-20-related protein